MASYADLDALQNWLAAGSDSAVTFTGGDQALAQTLLDTASRFIDRYTGRSFLAETAATKYFLPIATGYLDLSPDIRTVTSVALDTDGDATYSTTLASTDYYLSPLNPRPDAGIYNRLVIAPNSSQAFGVGERVKVVGDWGYVVSGAAPPNVQTACLLLAARWWLRKGAPFGAIQNTDIGTFRSITKEDGDVVALLGQYKTASVSWVML